MTISNPSLTQISQALAEMLPKLKPLSVPTGMISAFHTVPEGWLQCNGAAVSRTTYAALFAVVGTKYGSGDGSTTFNLPNLHHKFIEGTNTTSEVGQSVSAGLPNITGKVSVPVNFSWSGRDMIAGANSDDVQGYFDVDLSLTKSSIYGRSETVQPASIRLIPCVKT